MEDAMHGRPRRPPPRTSPLNGACVCGLRQLLQLGPVVGVDVAVVGAPRRVGGRRSMVDGLGRRSVS